jgi:tetratricopeptide (TPR) repeat protein
MSPHPAHAAVPTTPPGYPADPPAPQHFPQPILPPQPRIVWPWTAFLLGVAALIGVWYGRPYWRPNDVDRVRRDLAEMRSLLGRPTPDLGKAISLGDRVLDLGPSFPQHVGEAHFLLGCAHLRKAEEDGDPEAEWRAARTHFEEAEKAGVAEADQPRLAFRLGKALHLAKAEPQKALEYLRKGDDQEVGAERWQLIAECCLRQPEPDVKGAIEATVNQVPMIGPSDGRARAQAYSRLADLYLRSNQVADAKHALEEIKVADSPELFESSRVLLARCHQADGSYALAAAAWEQVRGKARPPVDRGTIAYELGFCYWKAGRTEEAKRAWDEAQSLGAEPAQASLIRKAEMQLSDPQQRIAAVATLEDAFKGILKSADYHNSLYPKAQAEQLLERTCQEFKTAAEWASAGKLAGLLTRLSGAAKGKELAVDVVVTWGEMLHAEARKGTGQAAKHAEEEAGRQFRTAALLAAELATPDRPPVEQAVWLQKAANFYLKCGEKVDVQNAVALLDRAEKLNPGAAPDGETAFAKAMALAQLGEVDKAIESYRACAKAGNPMQFRARYELARLTAARPAADHQAEMKQLDEVVEVLTANLDPALRESQADVAEMSAYLMGKVHFQRREFSKAEVSLAAAIRQFPRSDEATLAKYLLGRCYWFQAGHESRIARNDKVPEADREAAKKRMKEMLEKARQVAEPLEDELLKRETDQQLAEGDKQTLREASFLVAECYFFSEDFPESVRRYNILRLRYARQLEELIALGQLWQCYTVYLDRPEQGQAMLAAMRDLLKALPEDVLDNSSELRTRKHWEDWIKKAGGAKEK